MSLICFFSASECGFSEEEGELFPEMSILMDTICFCETSGGSRPDSKNLQLRGWKETNLIQKLF
jgi:hypothetical protein